MDAKLLTENGWKALALKFKLKDNGLQRALADYARLEEKKLAERLKVISTIRVIAANLSKDGYIKQIPVAANYLEDMAGAAQVEQNEIVKLKAVAEKAAKTPAGSGPKGSEADEKLEKQEEVYHVKLLAALQKLKGSHGLAYEFIVCEAKPHCAISLAKQIGAQHKAELTKITGGSKRFLMVGNCSFEKGKYTFTTDRPVTGLAKKIQDSIKSYTGKKLPILVGTESADEDDEK